MEIKWNINQVVWYKNKNGLAEKGKIVRITIIESGEHSYILNYTVRPLIPFVFGLKDAEYAECELYASAEALKQALIEEIDKQIEDLL